MRIGQSANSSHRAGMSALWHDAEYLPEKQLHTPTVEKGLEDLSLPSEQHQLPEGMADPFAKLEQVYDVAAEQMERGIRGQQFLNGKPVASRVPQGASAAAHDDPAHDPVDHAHDLTRTLHNQQQALFDKHAATNVAASKNAEAVTDQLQKRVAAGKAPPKVSNAAVESNATQKQQNNKAALDMAGGVGVAMAGVAVGQALDPTAMAGTMAADAAAVVKAAATSKLAVSMSKSISDSPDAVRTDQARSRRQSDAILGEQDPEES